MPYSSVSDARFKYNIQSNLPGLEFVKRLQPVTYYLDNVKMDAAVRSGINTSTDKEALKITPDKRLHTGFLAQDVEKIAKELGYEFDGVNKPENEKGYYSIAYSQFIMPLVKAVQE